MLTLMLVGGAALLGAYALIIGVIWLLHKVGL